MYPSSHPLLLLVLLLLLLHHHHTSSHYLPSSHTMPTDVYVLTTEVLGQGAHSSVSTCHHKMTGQEFAVKVAKIVSVPDPKYPQRRSLLQALSWEE